MLSLDRCRQIVGSESVFPDSKLKLLRDELYSLAEVAIDVLKEKTAEEVPVIRFSTLLERIPPNMRYEIEERAAIMELDGGMSREESERTAFRDYIKNHDSRA